MATSRNEITLPEPPTTVFAVLDDALAYPRWVVGARRIRGVDASWPLPGASFHHAVGTAALELHDRTTVIEREPPERMRLRVRFRPTGVATVSITVTPEDTGSRVVLEETPESGPAARIPRALVAAALWVRNAESLRRLRREVRRRAHLLT